MQAAILPSSLLPMGSYTPGPPYMDHHAFYILHCTCDNEAEEHTFSLRRGRYQNVQSALNTPFPLLPG